MRKPPIRRLTARVYRAPLTAPVQTSFGTMTDRPAVLVEAEDAAGNTGWGEVWCNFPAVGAEHRARLVESVIAPHVVGRSFATPALLFEEIGARIAVLAIQSGEHGPLAQALAGVDMALWDLASRRAGQPLYRLLGGDPTEWVGAYASGLGPVSPATLVVDCLREGHRSFKLKVGFGRDTDLVNLTAVRTAIGVDTRLMIDANQAWDLPAALSAIADYTGFGLEWLEEPIRADAPRANWQLLSRASPVPLATGENLRGAEAFAALLTDGSVQVIQPDLGKWGGFSGCLPVARAALAAGRRYCPHWLGGGIGLVASLHLLAAAGGDGLMEIDANPNPLRELMAQPFPDISEGQIAVPQGPGLGVAPDLKALAAHEVAH